MTDSAERRHTFSRRDTLRLAGGALGSAAATWLWESSAADQPAAAAAPGPLDAPRLPDGHRPERRQRPLNAQCIKYLKARAYFRYPDVDADGYQAMRLESEIGWRDSVYPGPVLYDLRGQYDWDGHPLLSSVAFDDPTLNGYAQQMFADGQFGELMELVVNYASTRTTCNLVTGRKDYNAFTAYPASSSRLPMTDGQRTSSGWTRRTTSSSSSAAPTASTPRSTGAPASTSSHRPCSAPRPSGRAVPSSPPG